MNRTCTGTATTAGFFLDDVASRPGRLRSASAAARARRAPQPQNLNRQYLRIYSIPPAADASFVVLQSRRYLSTAIYPLLA